MTTETTKATLSSRELRLPRWAQDELLLLRKNLAHAEAKLAAGPENSDTFADPHSGTVRPLGSGTQIRFGHAGHDGTFIAEYRDGKLHVTYRTRMHESALAVLPDCSNAVTLTGAPVLSRVQKMIAHQIENEGGDEFRSAEIARSWKP